MEARSEFQILLEEIQKRSEHDTSPKSENKNWQSTETIIPEDFLFKIFVDQSAKRFDQTAYKAQSKAEPKQSSQEVPKDKHMPNQDADKPKASDPKATTQSSLHPRIKLKLSFDQKKSLAVFESFKEKLDEYSTIDEIKSAYRRLARIYHPDTGAKDSEAFKTISSAYKKLIA